MKHALRLMVVGAFALLISVPAALAQSPEGSVLPVTEPLDVGGTILQPGVYTIRVLPSLADRNKVQITSPDLQTIFATVLTVPHALEAGEEMPSTKLVFYPAGEGMPKALRTWFAPNPDASGGGHDIVYQQERAQQLARLSHSSVVSYPAETVADNTDLQVVTPEAAIQPYVPPAPMIAETPMETPAPMLSNAPEQVAETQPEMPQTASRIPLIALFGLLSLGGALAFRLARS